MKVRKKPVVVEAMRYDGTRESANAIIEWAGGCIYKKNLDETILYIRTLDSIARTFIGDWIIKGVKGEFYPCEPDIFEQTYEVVEE